MIYCVFSIPCSKCTTLMTYKTPEEEYLKKIQHSFICKYCGAKHTMFLTDLPYHTMEIKPLRGGRNI